MHLVLANCCKVIMEEELSDSTMEALYGTVQNTPQPTSQKPAQTRRHHRRKTKPFVKQSPLKPYLLVSVASLVIILTIFVISK